MKSKKLISLIVGAGVVENAWAPVIRAIQPYYKYKLNSDSANCIFARIVYLLRWFSSIDDKEAKKSLVLNLNFINKLKKEICEEIFQAQKSGELKVRNQFENVIDRFVLIENSKFIVISTNWDTVVNEAIIKSRNKYGKIKNTDQITHHLHGNIISSDSLYLPSEVTRESYRTNEEKLKMGSIHEETWRTLELSNTSVLYGISLSPLDAELSQILAAGWDSINLKEIIIVDPEHEIISKRVKSLLKYPKKITVYGCDPNNLNEMIDYKE